MNITKSSLTVGCAAAFAAFIIPSMATAQEPQATTMAIFPFTTPKSMETEQGQALAELTGAHLSSSPNILTVERAEIEKALGEMELGLSGAVSAETASQAGLMLGAQTLITGRVISAGKENKAIAKVIGTTTGRVFVATADLPSDGNFDAASEALAAQISKIVQENRKALVGEPVTMESVVAQLRPLVEGKQLPTVAVAIPEEHLTRRVPDPAAETEMKRVLDALGFTILDDNAEVTVTGEAFSEFGMRKGNLISCRARIETKVRDTRNGGSHWVDRETAGAIDVAEHVAAKSALQKVGLATAERLVRRVAGEK